MKKRNLLAAAVLSLIGLGTAAVPARAATTYANDDLLLAFYATGGEGSTTSIVLNIGPASLYRDASGEFLLSVGSIATDLANTFGPDWFTREDVHWGVFGTTYNTVVGDDTAWTLYGARAQTTIGTQAQAFTRFGEATQSQPGTRIKDLGDAYATTGAARGLTVGSNTSASLQDASADNDFAGYQTNSGGTSFGYFNSALGSFGDGVDGTRLDLFRMLTSSTSEAGSYVGTFTIGTDGVVRFSKVPDPDPTPTPSPTPTATPNTPSGPPKATVLKQITLVKKQIAAAKKIKNPKAKAKKLKALKKKLQKLQQQLKSAA